MPNLAAPATADSPRRSPPLACDIRTLVLESVSPVIETEPSLVLRLGAALDAQTGFVAADAEPGDPDRVGGGHHVSFRDSEAIRVTSLHRVTNGHA